MGRFVKPRPLTGLIAALAVSSASNAQTLNGQRFLDNGVIKIGVDLGEGGAIVYLSQDGGPNMVNNRDLGRQIQMSFYSGPVPYAPNGKQPAQAWQNLGWNPIQTGDYYDHPSHTIEFESMGAYMHLRCVPMQWPLDNEPGECIFEQSIWLDGNVAHVHNRLINHRSDLTQYPARVQELPAIYSNAPWYRFMTYSGDKPFDNQPVSQFTNEPPQSSYPGKTIYSPECWAALVDKTGSGIGIVEPKVEEVGGMFFGTPGVGGEKDVPTGYISPRYTDILDSNIDYTFDYDLVVGSLDDIRDYAYARVPRPKPPAYIFKNDRQHWYYVNATDTGWPIQGELRIKLDKDAPQLIGPAGFWRASDAPKLKIEAAFNTRDVNARVFFGTWQYPYLEEKKSVKFRVIPDARYHTYTVNLARNPLYKGAIVGLRIDPEPKGTPGDEVRIRRIGFW